MTKWLGHAVLWNTFFKAKIPNQNIHTCVCKLSCSYLGKQKISVVNSNLGKQREKNRKLR